GGRVHRAHDPLAHAARVHLSVTIDEDSIPGVLASHPARRRGPRRSTLRRYECRSGWHVAIAAATPKRGDPGAEAPLSLMAEPLDDPTCVARSYEPECSAEPITESRRLLVRGCRRVR